MAISQNAQINVGVTGLPQLDKLQGSLRTLGDKFSGLKAKLAGLGFAAAARGAIQMADGLQDLSDSSGIAVGRLLELKSALVASGGSAEAMALGVNTFVRSIDEAAQGSLKAQNSFREVGIGLTELGKLSEQELLIRTVEGIAAIDDKGRQATLMMDKFGKSFKNVDPAGMASSLRASAGSADQYAASIKRAAELNDQLAAAVGGIKIAMIEAFAGPIEFVVTLNKEMSKSKETMATVVTIIKALGIALLVAFSFTGFGIIVRVIGTIGRGVGALTGLFTGVGATISRVFGASSTAMKILRGVGGLIAGIVGAVTGIKLFSNEAGETGTAVEEAKQAIERPIDTTAYDNAVRAVQAMGEAFDVANRKISDQVNLEAAMIGKSKETVDLMKAQSDLTKRTADEVARLTDARAKLGVEEKKAGLGAYYDEEIKKVQELGYAEGARITAAIQNLNRLEAAQQLELFRTKTRVDLESELMDVQHRIATGSMSEIQKKYADIDFAAQKSAKSAVAAEEARLGRRLNTEEVTAYYDAAIKGSEELKAINEEEYQNSRKFSTGWDKAFREYADNATNAARIAQDIFAKATKGMEDVLVNFAKTGKFEWKGFVNMMLEELLRAQIQSTFANIMGGMRGSMGGGRSGGGTSILGSIGNLLGFAGGGIVGGNKPILVGERGPEVFMPPGAGSIIPNNALGGGAASVTYNINAVDARSFKQMIASDPQFLYAVTQQGAKSIPGAR